MDFSQFASNLLASSSQPAHAQQPPLFISSRADRHPRSLARDDGDVLGSVEGEDVVGSRTGGRKGKGKMWVDDGLDEDGHEGSDDDDGPPASLVAPRTGTHGVVPAFVSKFGMTSPATGGVGGRGWKAYESIAASAAAFRHGHGTRGTARAGVVYSDGEGSSEEDEEDDGPLPGAFVSQREYAMDEPLVGVDEAQRRKETLYVYPVPATEGEADPPGYRDSGWIVAYGLCVLAVFALAITAWTSSPLPRSTTSPAVRASTSLLSTALPSLSLLTLISLFAGLSTLAYLLVLSHSLRTLLTLSILGAPFVFSATGIIAFAGSFGTSGVEADRGWKTGMRVFSVACFALAFAVGGEAVKRRKEMDRAINVGELACQTVLSHPPLVVLALALSLTSLALTIPCLTIIASLLSLSPTHPHLASYGTAFTLLVYLWSLAILRGISHATVGGVVGWWYFEREEEEEGGQGVVLGPMEVTRAAVARATGPSLGTVIAFSFFLSLFTTISTTLLTLSRLLRSSRIPTPLRPITALFAGLFTSIAASTAFFNSYALSYAGMTGQPWSRSTRETASLIRSNRARNIRDTALLRLTLFTITTTYSLLAGLLSFLLTSSSLAPSAGGYAPTLAILSYVIPAYTVKLCHDLVGDCVDALWVCVSLEASEGEGAAVVGGFSRCPKAVEAFGTPESETFNATAFV